MSLTLSIPDSVVEGLRLPEGEIRRAFAPNSRLPFMRKGL